MGDGPVGVRQGSVAREQVDVLKAFVPVPEGTVGEVGASAVVRAAYLGDESTAAAGSALAQLSEEAGQA